MNKLLVPVKESTVQRLRELANAQGIPVEQEAAYLLDIAVKRMDRMRTYITEIDAFAASLPPQVTDSADLIREDRDRILHKKTDSPYSNNR